MAPADPPLPGTARGAAVPRLDVIRARVAAHRPVVEAGDPHVFAATALILAPTAEGPAVLLIERATRKRDRWSGQIALPGGRREPGEPADQTARREALEEVGLDLGESIGRLDDAGGRLGFERVAAFVHLLESAARPVPQPAEVAAAFWVPLARLLDPATSRRHRLAGYLPFPARDVGGGATMWGLTHGIVGGLLEIIGTGWR